MQQQLGGGKNLESIKKKRHEICYAAIQNWCVRFFATEESKMEGNNNNEAACEKEAAEPDKGDTDKAEEATTKDKTEDSEAQPVTTAAAAAAAATPLLTPGYFIPRLPYKF